MDFSRLLEKRLRSAILANNSLPKMSKRAKKVCLALSLERQSDQCSTTFKSNRRDHQFCCRACYQKAHRIPGFVRNFVRKCR